MADEPKKTEEKTDAQRIMDGIDSIKKMCTDTAAKTDALASRMDSMDKEKADKAAADAAKADADEKERKEKMDKAATDKATADAAKLDAQNRVTDPAVTARLAALEAQNADLVKKLPAVLSNEDKAKYAHAQMVCDSAYQAMGEQAPAPLQAETLRDYRVRMLTKLKSHSKRYKDSDLASVGGDEAIFSNIEQQIINDSIEASTSNVTVGAPLRASTTIDKDSGHRVTRYYGDPAIAWADFMGGRARFGKIIRPTQTQH